MHSERDDRPDKGAATAAAARQPGAEGEAAGGHQGEEKPADAKRRAEAKGKGLGEGGAVGRKSRLGFFGCEGLLIV